MWDNPIVSITDKGLSKLKGYKMIVKIIVNVIVGIKSDNNS